MSEQSEREMLEWAARAAGLHTSQWADAGQVLPDKAGFVQFIGYGHAVVWNGLTDDGDALRLAVKLGERHLVKVGICRQLDKAYCHADDIAVRENLGSDPSAAVRKCIVRAAAAIGRAGGGS